MRKEMGRRWGRRWEGEGQERDRRGAGDEAGDEVGDGAEGLSQKWNNMLPRIRMMSFIPSSLQCYSPLSHSMSCTVFLQ